MANHLLLFKTIGNQLVAGQVVLGCTKYEIRERFPANKILPAKVPDEQLIEIRLSTATLTCVFYDHLCCASYLFLDDVERLATYITYCDKTYKKLSDTIWLNNKNKCIELGSVHDEDFFRFHLINRRRRIKLTKK